MVVARRPFPISMKLNIIHIAFRRFFATVIVRPSIIAAHCDEQARVSIRLIHRCARRSMSERKR